LTEFADSSGSLARGFDFFLSGFGFVFHFNFSVHTYLIGQNRKNFSGKLKKY